MWLQLMIMKQMEMKKIAISVILLILLQHYTIAQTDSYQMKGNDKEVTIDFLSSYYEQDGNNAAVTGGLGTEELQDFANVIVVNIPFDSINSISVTAGADYYTSASTDNIDNNSSSASSEDLRAYGTVSYSRKNLKAGESYTINVGGSSEYDYTSFSVGFAYSKEFNEGNTELNFRAQAFRDNWRFFIPIELRGMVSLPTSLRNSYNIQANFAQVINQRLQFSLSGELVYMDGLLSTPFHRVYFQDQTRAKLEKLPNTRVKIPLGIRLNYFPSDILILRSYYRFYTDDWGVLAHTFSLEAPVKVGNGLTLAPFFRYHTQSAADYFAPFAAHSITDEFYTSDFDLSDLNSQKYGLSIRVAPVYGISRMKLGKIGIFQFKSIDFRGAYYTRTTGLDAFIGTIGLSFGLK